MSSGILAYVGKVGTTYKPFIFGAGMGTSDVEISDDVFIITADEAKKHIEPPKLVTPAIHPERPQVKPGTHIAFQVKGLDQHARPMVPPTVTWTVKGGSGDGDGGFTAGLVEGEFVVEAAAGELRAQTVVLIAKQANQPQLPSPQPSNKEIKGVRWSGEVPAQNMDELLHEGAG